MSPEIPDRLKDWKFWVEVLVFILQLLLKGMTRSGAIGAASAHFMVSEDAISKAIGDKIPKPPK